MQIQISGKQLDISEQLRQHVQSRLARGVERYFADPIEAHVVFSRAGATAIQADCSVHVGHGIHAQARAEADSEAASFDMASDRLEKQLRRYKRRLRDHHNRQGQEARAALTARDIVLAPEPEDEDEVPETFQPVIVAEGTTRIETLSVGEAVMRMDLADLPVVMFRNGASDTYNVVYRRADGHIGWIEPSREGDQGE